MLFFFENIDLLSIADCQIFYDWYYLRNPSVSNAKKKKSKRSSNFFLMKKAKLRKLKKDVLLADSTKDSQL
jgi:hypothetical protein